VAETAPVTLQYKKIKNKIRNKTRLVEKKQNDIAAACNFKHFWKYVKSKTTSKEPISNLKYVDSHGNVHVASTDDSKAEALCNFFSSVFDNEDDNPFKYLEKKHCEFTFECPTFEVDDIRERLTKLNVNKSPGPDEIHGSKTQNFTTMNFVFPEHTDM